MEQSPTAIPLFVGTYTRPAPYLGATNGEGLYSAWFDTASGEIGTPECITGIENCSYLTVSPSGRTLHAIWEVVEWPVGLVTSYAVDGTTLSFLGTQSTKGALACYVTEGVDGAALVANYISGNVVRFPVRDDGSLAEATAIDQHTGSGPDPERQEGPHAHCIVLDPANKFAVSADLGTDTLVTYRADDPELQPVATLQLPPATGPRHLTFHPTKPFAYVAGEMSSTITALGYDPASGQFSIIGQHPLLPADFDGHSHAADIHVHPTAPVVYSSNRGHDSISVFSIADDGDVSLVATRSTEGQTPRNFVVSPDGRFLLAANQDSDSIVVIAADPATGELGDTVGQHSFPTPVCLKWGK